MGEFRLPIVHSDAKGETGVGVGHRGIGPARGLLIGGMVIEHNQTWKLECMVTKIGNE